MLVLLAILKRTLKRMDSVHYSTTLTLQVNFFSCKLQLLYNFAHNWYFGEMLCWQESKQVFNCSFILCYDNATCISRAFTMLMMKEVFQQQPLSKWTSVIDHFCEHLGILYQLLCLKDCFSKLLKGRKDDLKYYFIYKRCRSITHPL